MNSTQSNLDKNVTRILDQQANLKMIIERDIRIKTLKETIEQDKSIIDSLRKGCTKMGLDYLTEQSTLLKEQAKELEKFQMQQLKSIADDYQRHKEILDKRKQEVADLKKETAHEETNREAYLADVEKSLERQIQN